MVQSNMILTPKKKKYNLVYNNRFAILTRIVNLMQKFSLSLYISRMEKRSILFLFYLFLIFKT